MKITNKANAPKYKRDNVTSHLLVSASTTGAKFVTTSLVEMAAGGIQQVHAHETEQSYYIISGTGEMTVDDETRTVSAGDSIFIPSNARHGLINTREGQLVYMSAGSPPFGMEQEKELWPIEP